VHSDELKQIGAAAEASQQTGDLAGALQLWRQALALLPASSRQYAVISSRVSDLSSRVDTAASAPIVSSQSQAPRPAWAKQYGWVGAVLLGLWKFKFLATFLLAKGKLLLLGLTKASTVLTMAASLGVYWAEFGWKFAVGLVVSIYVHEMGHVAALRRYGIPASAPMFIPGLGAIVRLRQCNLSPREDARIGLAGPIWGTAAAIAAFGIGWAMHWPAWLAIGHVGAWINLFNLLPVWQLDGSRGFHALDRRSRFALLATVAVCWHYTNEGMLALILVVLGLRTFAERGPAERDNIAATQFIGLVITLTLLCFYSTQRT
jgi:Zn-dependent protease